MNAKKFLETKGIKDTLYYDGEWIKGDLSDLLEEYAAMQVKTCNKPAVIIALPDEDEITNAFVSVREQNLNTKLDYRDRDYFGLGVSFVGNWQASKGNEL